MDAGLPGIGTTKNTSGSLAPDRWVRMGDDHLKQQEHRQAVLAYGQAVNEFALLGNLPKAIATCKLILAVRPTHKQAQQKLAELYGKSRHQNDQQDAEASFSQELKNARNLSEGAIDFDKIVPPEGIWDDDELIDQIVKTYGSKNGLPRVPLFDELSTNEFVDLISELETVVLPDQTTIIREGESADAFYILSEGIVQVTKNKGPGNTVQLGEMRSGDFFGEIALIEDTTRTASVTADGPVELLKMTREQLDRLMTRRPRIRRHIKRFYRYRLLRTVLRFDPKFEKVPPDMLMRLIRAFEHHSFHADQTIVAAEEVHRYLWVIERGQAQWRDANGPQMIGRGSYVGALGAKSQGSLVAQSPVVAFGLPINLYKRLFDAMPEATRQIDSAAYK